jgi:tetratricopeptide (TPR) repeat protein
MYRPRWYTGLLLLLAFLAPTCKAQLGQNVVIPAGSEVDHELTAINNATENDKKLELIEQFAAAHPDGDFAIVADEQFVTFYINAKQYDKAFVYGDKLFTMDPENYNNAVNMVRAANEKGDTERIFTYGEKANAIVQRFKAAPAPSGTPADSWDQQRTQKLDAIKENQEYVEQSLLGAAYQQKDPTKKAEYLQRFAKDFPDSPHNEQALTMAAFAYQQVPNRPKMQEIANVVLVKDPSNIGILLLLANDYSEKNEQLDKAEAYAKKAASLCETAKKPEGVSAEDWQKQITLQKGLALSALGQVDLEKKDNASAVKNLSAATPLLKSNAVSYAGNQYRLGFAYLNLKNTPGAKQAFTEAASVDSPYRAAAQGKLKDLEAQKTVHKKAS